MILLATLLPGAGPGEGATARTAAGLADAVRNVLLFAPLGAALARLRFRPAAIAAGGLALSGAVELAQIALPGRDPSAADVAANAVGLALGAAAGARLAAGGVSRGAAAFLAAFGAAALLLPFAAFRPVAYVGPYYPSWTPEPPPHRHFPGRVLDARIGDAALPAAGRWEEWAPFEAALARGEPLRLRAALDGSEDGLAPMLKVNGEGLELLLVAADGRDLVVWQRTIGQEVGLESSAFTLRNALAGVATGAPFDLALRRGGAGWSVQVEAGAARRLGPTPGSAWRLFAPAGELPEAARRALDALAVALVVAIVGRCLGASASATGGLALVVAGLLAGAGSGAGEWLGAAGALALVRLHLRRQTPGAAAAAGARAGPR